MLPTYISQEKPVGWNKTAVECFNIKCKCEKCNIYKIYFKMQITKCKMKYYVTEMYKRFGKP